MGEIAMGMLTVTYLTGFFCRKRSLRRQGCNGEAGQDLQSQPNVSCRVSHSCHGTKRCGRDNISRPAKAFIIILEKL